MIPKGIPGERAQVQRNTEQRESLPLPSLGQLEDLFHDIRGFLNLILPSVDIIRRQITRMAGTEAHATEMEKVERCLRNIRVAVEQIERLSDTIHPDQPREGSCRQNLKDLLQEIVECYQNTHSKGHRVYELYYSIKEIYWSVDKSKLTRVLNNLLSNATKYTPHGVIILKAEETDDCLEISVKDPGVGISRDKIDHLFERFYQAGGEHQQSGSGIGLDITLALIKSMDGTIKVNSREGIGTVFTIKLPKT